MVRTRLFLLLLLFLQILFFTPTAILADNAAITDLVEKFIAESQVPGISLSILEKGEIDPFTISRGSACLSNDVPMNKQTIMKLGSLTKLFTAARIKMLIEGGKLDYQTPISKFFPNFPGGDTIKIRHLLTHTSGLHEMLSIKALRENMCKPWTPQEILSMVEKEQPAFPPGTAQKYCNTGFLMLGLIIESITGDSFENQIIKKIAIPLGMTSVQSGDDLSIIKHEACGYRTNKSGELCKPFIASMVPPFATGNFIGSSEDLIRFFFMGRLLKDNFIDTPDSDLKPHVLDTGKSAYTSEKFLDLSFNASYLNGFTMFQFHDRNNLTLIGKSGMFPGFASWFLYNPETHTAVSIVLNNESRCNNAMQLAVRIFQLKQKQ